ncbi:CBS domain-containing protein, partial [Vibrio sinaloensis]
MSSHEKIRVRDVMANNYVMIDGLRTVSEGIDLAREHRVKALVVNKRNDDDEYGLV